MAELSHHTNLVLLEPIAVDKTRVITYALTSGANEVFTFGRYEKLIGHFHRSMNALLDAC